MSLSVHSRKGTLRRRWKCPKHGNSTAYGKRAECGCAAHYYDDKRKQRQFERARKAWRKKHGNELQ